MVAHVEIEFTRRAPAVQLDVVAFVSAFRHFGVRQVRQAGRHGVGLGLQLIELGLGGVETLAQITDFCQQRRDVFAACLGITDGLGAGVALVLQGFRLDLQVTAARFQRGKGFGIQLIATTCEALGSRFKISAQKFRVQHVGRLSRRITQAASRRGKVMRTSLPQPCPASQPPRRQDGAPGRGNHSRTRAIFMPSATMPRHATTLTAT